MALIRDHLKRWIGMTAPTPASPAVARCLSVALILCLTGSLGDADGQSPKSGAGERGAIETLREEAGALRQDIQQQEAEFILEVSDLTAQRRLRDVQL